MKCSVKCKCKCYPIQIPGSVVLVMHIVPNSEGSFIHRVASSIVRIVLIVVISRVKYEFGLKWMCDCDFATPNCRAVPLFCHYGAAFFQIPPISAPAFHVSREVILLFLTSPTVKYFASIKQCPASRRRLPAYWLLSVASATLVRQARPPCRRSTFPPVALSP